MLLDTLSTPLTKALQAGNSLATSFQVQSLQQAVPTGDGVIPIGVGGLMAANRLFLIPFGEGAIGSQFSMRVYGWHGVDHPEGIASQQVMFPCFLCEVLCTLGDLAGPGNQSTSLPVPFVIDSERCCDTITLTQGLLGASSPGGGFINSTGPGTGLLASLAVELMGARFVSFDFQAADTGNQVGMNCFWSRG